MTKALALDTFRADWMILALGLMLMIGGALAALPHLQFGYAMWLSLCATGAHGLGASLSVVSAVGHCPGCFAFLAGLGMVGALATTRGAQQALPQM